MSTLRCAIGVEKKIPKAKSSLDGLHCIQNASFTKSQRLTNSQENKISPNGAILPTKLIKIMFSNTQKIKTQSNAWQTTTVCASGVTQIPKDLILVDGPTLTWNVNFTISQQSTNSQEKNNAPAGAINKKTKLNHTNAPKTTLTCAIGVKTILTAKIPVDGPPCMKNASFIKSQRLTNSQEIKNALTGAIEQLVQNTG